MIYVHTTCMDNHIHSLWSDIDEPEEGQAPSAITFAMGETNVFV